MADEIVSIFNGAPQVIEQFQNEKPHGDESNYASENDIFLQVE
jgi:hypothetical protein